MDMTLEELLPLLGGVVQPGRLQVVLFLEDHLEQDRLSRLVKAGAQVICRLQRFEAPLLASAISTALCNRPWLDPLFANLSCRQSGARPWQPVVHGSGGVQTGESGGKPAGSHRTAQPWELPNRERELLRHVGQGYSTQEISERLGIRCDSVRHSLSRIYRRIGVRDRAQAVGWCLCHGLISRHDLWRRYHATVPLEDRH